ncbi:MAG: prohibitin family protein [Burkholderiales bacterium]|nr:prohibitin family protein [Burkholderiales bacterium]
MSNRIKQIVSAVGQSLAGVASKLRRPFAATPKVATLGSGFVRRNAKKLIALGLFGAAGYALYAHPPVQNIERGEVGVRINQLTGTVSESRDGTVWVIPGLHQLRRYPLRDQTFRPAASGNDNEGTLASFQSVEGLSLGVDIAVRYALDPTKIASMATNLPEDLGGEVVRPAVDGVIYKVFTRYTVREIFSSKRAEIVQSIEAELKPKLAADGIALRGVQVGRIELPAEYKSGMEKLLAEELASEKMRYTLELKEKQVKETALEADAAKVRREKAAEAAANEQVIAARAQEEAMKHVLPFKHKQIEQRQLEAEAERQSRVKMAEGAAQARRIEAAGEADSRQKLADAEAYRLDRVGKVSTEQMAREGAVITRHPLLIQKTLADKLSDKVSVIIAPAPTNGDFIGAALLGKTPITAKVDSQVARATPGTDEAANKEGE